MTSEGTGVLRRPVSLAWRVTALVGAAMLLVFLVFNWISVRSLDLHFAEMDEEELEGVSDSVIKALGEMARKQDPQALQRAVSGHHGVYYYVADSAGRVLYASEGGPDLGRFAEHQEPIRLETGQRMTAWQEAGHHYRGAVLRVGTDHLLEENYTIAVTMDIGVHVAFIRDFKRIQRWAVLVVMCLAILVAWVAVRWGHIPIRKANEKIRAITSSRLHVRLDPGDVPIELEETIASFNAMLGRIEDGYARLSNVSADIAHELRTPVTNLTTQTEIAVGQARSAEEYREILYSNLEELGRLNRMINDMLFLAQTENAPENIRVEELDVAETVQALFEYFDAWVEECGVSLQLLGTSSRIHADKAMLRRALSNLLSNAIRYTPSGKEVKVHIDQDREVTRVCVENQGPKIDPKDLSHLFSRFYRADPSRQRKGDGAGLGLAIVKTIVNAHGGQVYAESDDHSTRFYMMFPLLDQEGGT